MRITDINQVVIVRDMMTQEFDGIEYRKSGKWPYFERFGKRLHRVVWEWHNGPIAEKHQIHHRDEDRDNNQIENLAILSECEHKKLHQTAKKKQFRRHVAICKRCGSQFQTVYAQYCGVVCSTAAWRKSGAIAEDRKCVICDSKFSVGIKYRKTATCSRLCTNALISLRRSHGRA